VADHQFQAGCPRYVPPVGLIVGFSLQQFSEVFRIQDATGQPYVLIGGQAVNYWAERYLPVEPELKPLQPFTSEDIDFKGGTDDVRRIADQLKRTPVYPSKAQMTVLAGAVPFKIGDLKSNIEIVRRIRGISGSAEALAIRAEWNGMEIRVLDPISLLACKLELAACVPQENRRDVMHLTTLVPCVRAFLGEFLRQVERGEIPARHWLDAANQVLKLTTNHRARVVAKKHPIDWMRVLPLTAIAECRDPKIKRFHDQQLRQGYRKSKGISTGI
jgi:hypothetical protein